MIVKGLKLIKKNKYEVIIDDDTYLFDEEIIVKFRLVLNKEIDQATLKRAIKSNNNINYYNKALDYALKYGKNKAQIYDYLTNKGLDNSSISDIISELDKIKVLDDDKLIANIIDSLIKKGNGKLLIEKKLYERQFPKDLIIIKINEIDNELYIENMIMLYEKIKNKYSGSKYEVKMKIIKYLLSRGYSYSDIENIEF